MLEDNKKVLERLEASLRRYQNYESIDKLFRVPENLYLDRSLLTSSGAVEAWVRDSKAYALDYREEEKQYLTRRGERVRSKSEEIIANLLYELDLPYKYECSLSLDYRVVYPDFTIYDVNRGCEVYWEHFGLLDQEDYMRSAWNKIAAYERNGYEVGEEFLFSYEMKGSPLNEQDIRRKLLKRFFPEQL